MSREIHEPTPGPLPSGSSEDIPTLSPVQHPPGPIESPPPPAPPTTSNSGDELNALLTQSIDHPAPDPLLGAFSADAGSTEPDEPSATDPSLAAIDTPVPPQENTPSSLIDPAPPVADSIPASSVDALSDGDVSLSPDRPVSADSFDAISALASFGGKEPAEAQAESDLSFLPVDNPLTQAANALATSPESSSKPNFGSAKTSKHVDSDDDEEEDELEPARAPWWTALLISYASAVTVGLIWVLVTGRTLRESENDLFPPVESSAEEGLRGGQSRVIEPIAPLAADHQVALGKSLRVGSLEIKPVEVFRGNVQLVREIGDPASRAGGVDALWLRLQLRNLSKNALFVPLDEAFVREQTSGRADSYIESNQTLRVEPYPLAVTSEWSIEGQKFEELAPRGTIEALVVSAPEALNQLTSTMTWRVKLRTGVKQTDVVGVTFEKEQVRE